MARGKVQPPDFTEVSVTLAAVLKHVEKFESSLGSLRQSHQDLEASTVVEIADLKENLEEYKKVQSENYQTVLQLLEEIMVPMAAVDA